MKLKLDENVGPSGLPVGKLTPLPRRRFVPAEVAVAIFKAALSNDASRFRSDLDAWADQNTLPRA